MSPLSPVLLCFLLLCFGLAGIVTNNLLAAFTAGGGGYAGAYLFVARVLGKAQSSSHHSLQDVKGLTARLTTSVAPGQPGEAVYVIHNVTHTITAVSDAPIPSGAVVRVVDVVGNTARVTHIIEAPVVESTGNK